MGGTSRFPLSASRLAHLIPPLSLYFVFAVVLSANFVVDFPGVGPDNGHNTRICNWTLLGFLKRAIQVGRVALTWAGLPSASLYTDLGKSNPVSSEMCGPRIGNLSEDWRGILVFQWE